MAVQLMEPTYAVADAQQVDLPQNGTAENPSSEVSFEEALDEAMDPKAASVPGPQQRDDISRSSAQTLAEPVEYAFAQGPGYGTGVGSGGYGSDDSPDDVSNGMSSEETGVARYAFARGPGYGSGVGTMGYAEDSSMGPDDLTTVVPSSERVAQKYASAAQLGHESNVSINELESDWNLSSPEVEAST